MVVRKYLVTRGLYGQRTELYFTGAAASPIAFYKTFEMTGFGIMIRFCAASAPARTHGRMPPGRASASAPTQCACVSQTQSWDVVRISTAIPVEQA